MLPKWAETALRETKDQRADIIRGQNNTLHQLSAGKGHSLPKKSVTSSDEGLVLEPDIPTSANDRYPDSMESARRSRSRNSAPINSADSLELRSPPQRPRFVLKEQPNRRKSLDESILSSSVDEAIRHNRDKLRLPKLISLQHRQQLQQDKREQGLKQPEDSSIHEKAGQGLQNEARYASADQLEKVQLEVIDTGIQTVSSQPPKPRKRSSLKSE